MLTPAEVNEEASRPVIPSWTHCAPMDFDPDKEIDIVGLFILTQPNREHLRSVLYPGDGR